MNITIGVLTMFSISFFIAYLHAAINLKKTTSMLTELILVHLASSNSIPDSIQNITSPEDLHKENFIKFLSESRDWAYQYIEDVQKGLSDFISEVEPSIKYFNEYGIVIEGTPLYKDMKNISSNFEKLKKFLPEDTDDRR